ncbi:unnamed protein product [Rhizoctonia solani]|uniref:Fe2OG dioxygenase domain-containing protein n=1 Tax=Rhizoctonia solani TaxID=456999 RepID=A0A8H2XUC6_9AGAM|nr:unnamed protein product [Rhizoctonia solani]
MKEGDDESDIIARELVQAWFNVAYTDPPGDGPAPDVLSTTGKGGDIRYLGFFQTQRSLAEVPNKALSFLNASRKQLGLSQVDSNHPSLVPPEFSQEHHDLIIMSSHKSRRQGPQVKARKGGRRDNKAGEKRKPQMSRRSSPSAGKNKLVSHTTRGPVPATEKPSESDQETDIWSDVPDEPPQPEGEGDPTAQSSGSDIRLDDEVDVPQPTFEPDGKPKKGGSSTAKQTLGTRSSMRLAVSQSLKTQIAVSPPTQQKPKSPASRGVDKKSRKKQSQARNKRKTPSVAPVSEPDAPVTSNPPFPTNPAAGTFERDGSDGEPDDVPLKDCVPLHQTVEANATNVDVHPPYTEAFLHEITAGIKPSLINEAPALDATPPVDVSMLLEPPPFVHAPSLLGPLPPPSPLSAPPSNELGAFTWGDTYLSQHVRIPVWAKSRQELCELPYFKSMQGGVYTRGNTVYGYLLGRFPSPRDAWRHEGRLIISHGGGKNVVDEGENDPTKTRHQLGDDQLESDKSVRALLTSYRMFRPIVILAEADYEPLRKFKLRQGYTEGASYYVLGHYAIVAAWAEHEQVMPQGFIHTRWKFAFQYIEGNQGPPWWLQPPGANINRPGPPGVERITQAPERRRKFGGLVSGDRKRVSEVTTESFTGAPSIECGECQALSPHVYTLGPICLNPDCLSFWKYNGLPVSQAGLAFNPGFLALRGLPEQLQRIPYPIVPEYPDWQHRKNGESIFNRRYWAGACCHRCGRVSCRQKWQCWECLTCGLRREESRPQIYDTSCLLGPMDCETQGGGVFSPYDMKSTSRVVQYHDGHSRLAIYYELPDSLGRIVHVLNNPKATQQADQLFQQYQRDASSMNMFQRHAMKTHGVKGELYAQHYSHNAGAPYKYIAEAVSTPFEDCPKSVVEAKDHIQYLCEPALGKEVKFNEVLSVAYAEGQEMNFHSDDEPGLGPVVAGLTLGSHAEMLFRYHIACKKNLIYKNGPFRPSEARTSDEQDSNDRVLQITLSHGDLLIMDGTEIQKQYEHAVFVRDTDMVRFAATARFIHPSVPTVVRGVHQGRHPNQESAYISHGPVWESQIIPPPSITCTPHITQTEIP